MATTTSLRQVLKLLVLPIPPQEALPRDRVHRSV